MIYMVADGAVKCFVFALAIGLTHLLSQEDYGRWGLLMSTVGLLTPIFGFGFSAGASRWFFDRPKDTHAAVVFTLLAAQIALGLTLLGILHLLAPSTFDRLFDGLAYNPLGRLALLAAALASLPEIPISVAVAQRRAALAGWLSVARSFFPSAAMLMGALAQRELVDVMMGLVAGHCVAAMLSLNVARGMTALRIAWREFGGLLAYSLPIVPHLVGHWLLGFADRYMLSHFRGNESVAVYHTSYSLGIAVSTLVMALVKSWSPMWLSDMGEFYDETTNTDPDLVERIRRKTRSVAGFAALIGGLVALWGDELLLLLLTAEYQESLGLVAPITAGTTLLGLGFVPVMVLYHHRRTALIPVLSLSAGAVNIAMNFWAIPRHGAQGAAWATAASYLVLLIFMSTAAIRSGARPLRARDFTAIPVAALLILPALVFGEAWDWPARYTLNLVASALLVVALHLGGNLTDLSGFVLKRLGREPSA